MLNGQQKSELNVLNFQSWIESMTDSDFKQIVYRGQLSRSEIAKAICCATSALRQNPRLRESLAELENDLRDRGVLPQMAESQTDEAKKYNQNEKSQNLDKKRLTSLEQENVALKAEIELLKRKLSRFEELNSVLADLGKLPQ